MAASIGIVGCGSIGQALLLAAQSGAMAVTIAGVTSRGESKAKDFLATLRQPPPYLDRGQLIARSDLVVETAGGHVVPELAEETFAAGKDLMVISIGALLDHPEIIEQSRRPDAVCWRPREPSPAWMGSSPPAPDRSTT